MSETRILQAEIILEDIILVNSDPIKYEVKIHCKNCDCLNVIEEVSGRG